MRARSRLAYMYNYARRLAAGSRREKSPQQKLQYVNTATDCRGTHAMPRLFTSAISLVEREIRIARALVFSVSACVTTAVELCGFAFQLLLSNYRVSLVRDDLIIFSPREREHALSKSPRFMKLLQASFTPVSLKVRIGILRDSFC